MTPTPPLRPGFAEPAIDAAQAFRAIMRALARPGTVETAAGVAPPPPLSTAAGAILLTLCDADTPLYLAGEADCDAVRAWITFHTGAPPSDAAGCSFALGTWEALLPLEDFPIGTAEYPDRSATLIVEMPDLRSRGVTLCGPGIRSQAHLPLPETEAFRRNAARFPLGLDFLFTSGELVAGLPRTSRVEAV